MEPATEVAAGLGLVAAPAERCHLAVCPLLIWEPVLRSARVTVVASPQAAVDAGAQEHSWLASASVQHQGCWGRDHAACSDLALVRALA